MSKMYLAKFPVTYDNGNEYLSIIRDSPKSNRHVDVSLYKKVVKESIFENKKIKLQKLNVNGSGYGAQYEEELWNYDYKEMAINEVIGYEIKLNEQKQHEISREKSKVSFENWDGKLD